MSANSPYSTTPGGEDSLGNENAAGVPLLQAPGQEGGKAGGTGGVRPGGGTEVPGPQQGAGT